MSKVDINFELYRSVFEIAVLTEMDVPEKDKTKKSVMFIVTDPEMVMVIVGYMFGKGYSMGQMEQTLEPTQLVDKYWDEHGWIEL